MPSGRKCLKLWAGMLLLARISSAAALEGPAHIQYDTASHVFRMDAAEVTYAFGVNERQELQTRLNQARDKQMEASKIQMEKVGGGRMIDWCRIG